MFSHILMVIIASQIFSFSANAYESFSTRIGHEKVANDIISGAVEDSRNHYDLEFNLQLISPPTRLALETMKYRVLQIHERYSKLCGVGVGSIELILADEDINTNNVPKGKNPYTIAQSEYLKKYAKGHFSPIVVFPKSDYDYGWAYPKFAQNMLQVPENLYDSVWLMRRTIEPGGNMNNHLEHELGHLFGLYHLNEDYNIMTPGGSSSKDGNQFTEEQCKVIRASPLVHPRQTAG